MNTPILFTDLDQTLIYSSRQLKRHGQTTVGSVIVEEYLGEPLSMTSLKAMNLISAYTPQLLRLVPVTTRTLSQYERISIPYVDMSTFVVLNGARIFVDGHEIKSWTKKIRKEIYKLETNPHELYLKVKEDTKAFKYLKGVHKADGFFVYLVAEEPGVAHIDRYVKQVAEETGYVLSQQGRKSYLMPPGLTKGRAIAELKERFEPTMTFAAGDSVLDVSMAKEVDHFILPVHGEATRLPEEQRPGHITSSRGIESPGEILDFVGNIVKASLF